jgi:hypothetical protein
LEPLVQAQELLGQEQGPVAKQAPLVQEQEQQEQQEQNNGDGGE